jgi:glycosyltransferase involved in cell wall biosynthesis
MNIPDNRGVFLKKVLFIDHDFGFSGATVSLKYLVSFFIDSGVGVTVLTPKSKSDQTCFTDAGATCISSLVFNREFLRLGLHFTDKQSLLTARGMLFLVKEITRFFLGMIIAGAAIVKAKPDLVYINEYVSLPASVAGKLLGRKTACHIRSPFLSGTFGIRRRLLANAIVAFNDVVFPITEFESNQIKRRAYKNGNIIVVHEFLDKEDFRSRICGVVERSQLKLPLGRKIITMFGGIYAIKGTLDFLMAAEIVLGRNKNVFFAIAGKEYMFNPAYFHECRRFAAQPHLQKNVALLGEIYNKTDLIGCSTAIVSANTETHFSRPIIEAWAQKKPVVATDTEHNLNLVEHETDGLIVKTGDHGKMAEAIHRLISDDAFAARLGANGYEKALRQFDAAQNAKKILSACAVLINKNAKQAT